MSLNELRATLQQETAETETPETETPADSPSETKPEGETASPAEGEADAAAPEEGAKKTPEVFSAFHDHPKWKARERQLKEYQAQIQELNAFKEQVSPLLEKLKPQEKIEKPQWFRDAFGEDENLWSKFNEYDASRRQALKEEVLAEIRGAQEKEAQATKQWDTWVNKELETLEEEGITLDKNQRNELLNVAVTYQPSDEQGLISLRKAYELWKLLKPNTQPKQPTEEKKKIADATMKKSASEETKDYKTPADLRGRGFRDFAEV